MCGFIDPLLDTGASSSFPDIKEPLGAISPSYILIGDEKYTIASFACYYSIPKVKLKLVPNTLLFNTIYFGLSNIYKNFGRASITYSTMMFGTKDDYWALSPYTGQTIPIWLSTEPPPY